MYKFQHIKMYNIWKFVYRYQIALGTTPGGGQIKPFFDISIDVKYFTIGGLDLMGQRKVSQFCHGSLQLIVYGEYILLFYYYHFWSAYFKYAFNKSMTKNESHCLENMVITEAFNCTY